MKTDCKYRTERDGLGSMAVPIKVYYGIHTRRAVINFPLSGSRLDPEFIKAFAKVKEACALTNLQLGYLDKRTAEAIIDACREICAGELHEHIIVDPFQGGAGTSTNMNFNEVIANRANELLGGMRGDYFRVNPLGHVNLHQSTNDVYPSALAVACITKLMRLEEAVSGLQEVMQEKEKEFSRVVKTGRTQLMDAVPMTLGMEFGAFAEAFSRDRWRIFKSRERIKRINLGGTAIGTGLGAPRDYIMKAADNLKRITGLPLSRAENLVDATQNTDRFVEVSGHLKTFATNLIKISSDLRLLGSGPSGGLAEITLPPVQSGSSIMAGKINPVIPEAATQVGLKVLGNDHTLSISSSLGQLELNHLMPLIAHTILDSLNLLINISPGIAECCKGIKTNTEHCLETANKSKALAAALVPHIGYERVEQLLSLSKETGSSIRELLIEEGFCSPAALDNLLAPEALHKLGFIPGELEKSDYSK